VQRRQAENFADRDAQIYADRQNAYQQQVAPAYPPPPAAVPAPAPPPPEVDVIGQLEKLGELHAQGILTDEEFAGQKAKLLNS
jgi:hypothetical protein